MFIKKRYLIITAVFCALLLFSCKKSTPPPVSSVDVPQYNQGLITFMSGEVFITRNGESSVIDIGGFAETDDIIKTSDDSYCEIQFGNKAVIMIEENTEIQIPVIQAESGKTDISIQITAGTVLNKVNRLANNESYEIKTQSAICGVRGTEFMVSSEENVKTGLYVKEGTVAFFPADINISELRENLSPENDNVNAVLDRIENKIALVESNQEIEITYESSQRILQSYQNIQNILTGEIDSEDIAALENYSEEIIIELTPAGPLSEEASKNLEKIDYLVIHKLPVPVEGKVTSAEDLVKVHIKVDVPDAEIIMNGRAAGKGNFSGVFTEGQPISFLVTREGYEDQKLDITAQSDSENKYNISLVKMPEPEVKTSQITIKAVPDTAEILIDGNPEGRGEITGDFQSDSTYSVLVMAAGYQKRFLSITEPEEDAVIEVELLPSLERRIRVSSGRLTGYIASADRKIYTADSYGEVIAADLRGTVLWKIQTGNTPNERAFPVIINNNLFFSGAYEFYTVDRNTGDIKMIIDLEDDNSHVFGRRVTHTAGIGLYPGNSRIYKFSLESGEFTGEIPVPDGIRMTPGIYQDTILAVNQKGMFYRIDPQSGGIISSLQTPAVQPLVNKVSVSGNRAYFNGRNGEIVCISLDNNSIQWTHKLSESKAQMVTGDLLSSSSGVYVFSENKIYGFSADTGKRLFPPIEKVTSPPVLSSDRLYFGTSDSYFHTADSTDGKILDSIKIPANISASPYYDRGKVYAGTESGEILVLNP